MERFKMTASKNCPDVEQDLRHKTNPFVSWGHVVMGASGGS